MRKKILFLVSERQKENSKRRIHYEWAEDCKDIFNISLWGPGYSDVLSINNLKNYIDKVKPDYIYCYNRSRLSKWLPDISSVTVPKIMTELDTYKYNPLDDWYKQFDKIYCRINDWRFKYSRQLAEKHFIDSVKDHVSINNLELNKKQISKIISKQYSKYLSKLKNTHRWKNITLLRWSVCDSNIFLGDRRIRFGTGFVGRKVKRLYEQRRELYDALKNDNISFCVEWDKDKYLNLLKTFSALICPTESSFGDFVPAKLFEFAASGSAIITNCNLIDYKMEDLNEVVIRYSSIEDLKDKLEFDFQDLYNKSSEIMKSHTNHIRYREIFI